MLSEEPPDLGIFQKFDQLWRPLSPSSRGVRGSDYVRSRALDVNFKERKKSENILSQKSYDPISSITKSKIRLHSPKVLGRCQAEMWFTDASDSTDRDPKCSLTRGLVDTRSPIFSSHFDARCCLRHEIWRCLVHACTNVTFLTTIILIATPPKIYCRTRYKKKTASGRVSSTWVV